MYQGPTGLDGARVLIKLFGESCSLSMESSGENLCVYGLGECPGKVIPQDPGAAAVSQMIQPLLQMNANIYAMLPSFCPNCPKRIIAVERELAQLRKPSK